ncbi:unnamed protein product [Durusdinium trenchii]|uniref:Uncharacterized protein n=1 Tax=Durusdinium trenchii TaxID=1381693 RepID=A0ABP0N9D0_9DINO
MIHRVMDLFGYFRLESIICCTEVVSNCADRPFSSTPQTLQEVNSSGKAFNVLETLRRLGPSLLRRKRQRLRQWLPSLVVEPQTCGMRRAHGRNRTGATGSTPAAARLAPPTALQLAMAEDPSDPEAPSLMWLLAEDGATEHSHVRVCDRNFVVLKVKRLLLNMEKERFKMASVLKTGLSR